MADWFRQKSWSKEIEDFYFSKLDRARKDGRAQYLRIQAVELIQDKELQLLDVAESLLIKLLTDYPDNRLERSCTFCSLGDIYKLRGNFNKAIEYYKEALDFEKIYPNVRSWAPLSFSELVVKTGKVEYYDLVEELLADIPKSLFPIEKYKGYSILSIISRHNNKKEEADNLKRLAEQYANKETSGLRYHKYLGIVKERDSWLDKLIKEVVKYFS